MTERDLANTYLDAFRGAHAPNKDAKARNLARLRERLAEREAADEDPPAPSLRHGRAASFLFVAKSTSVSVLLGVIGLGAVKAGALAAGYAPPNAEVEAVADPVEQRSPARVSSSPAEPKPASEPPTPLPATVPKIEVTPVPPATQSPAHKPSRAPKPADPTADALRAEVELMRRASAALEANRWQRVLQLTAEHTEKFPQGVMVEERRAWFALASCATSRGSGKSAARVFEQQHPRSALLAKVRAACQTIPNSKKSSTDSSPGSE